MECSICFNEFDLKERLPKALPCGHTFCVICMQDYVVTHNSNRKCPLCKQGIACSNAKDIPNNFSLMVLLEQKTKQSDPLYSDSINQSTRVNFRRVVDALIASTSNQSQQPQDKALIFECNRNLIDNHGDLREVYYELKIPEDITAIMDLNVKVWSKDQGWASVASSHSLVYLELKNPGVQESVLRRLVCSNYRLHEYTMREVHLSSLNAEHKEKLKLLKPGAIIQIIAESRYPGWRCHVNKAIIEITPYRESNRRPRKSV